MNITIHTHTDLWSVDPPAIEAILACCAAHLALKAVGDVAVVLTDDEEIRQLNRDFRGKDKATNVLSFPSDADEELGDLIFAYGTIAQEAEVQGKRFAHHFAHLLVHGMLHLLGYDHERADEAREMEALEVSILAQMAIANPYEND